MSLNTQQEAAWQQAKKELPNGTLREQLRLMQTIKESVTMATATVPDVQTIAAPKVNILDSALMLTIVRKWPPQQRTVKAKILQSTANSAMITVSKKLFDCKELKDIISNETILDAYIKRRSSPMPLRNGFHLLASDLFDEVENHLNEHKTRRVPLIEAFKGAYMKTIDSSKELLGDQFNPDDYPSLDRLDNYFLFNWQYIDFSVSSLLKNIDKEAAERKGHELKVEILQATEVQKQMLREEFLGLVQHLTERLAPTVVDGEIKKKTFRDSMLDKMVDFKEVFAPRNLSKDAKLAELVGQTNSLLTGVDATQLRTNDDIRKHVQEGFSKIKDNLAKLIIDEPSRTISFDEV